MQTSAISEAVEAKDYATVLAEIRKRVDVDQHGCWNWKERRSSAGYAVLSVLQRRNVLVHRLSLEASYGRELGSQNAHHVCANRCCVNPDHLQPVTHQENTAEMLHRQAYLRRIAELEAALRVSAPGHPLLEVVEVQ